MQDRSARVIGAELDLAVVQNWRDSCELYHGSKCRQEPREMIQMRLIDVERMCIVNGDSSYRYFALSYIWGKISQFQTLKCRLPELEIYGSLSRFKHLLPRTVNDAIALVSALHEKFLWVDALCIVQDDSTDKQIQISQMDNIYGQATLTIVALSGKDANSGLPGVTKRSWGIWQIPEMVRGIRLVAKLPELFSAIETSEWRTRGWTLQETILSKRCLFFSDTQIYFQCRSSYYTEDSPRERHRGDPVPGEINPFEWQVTESDYAYDSRFNIYESLVKDYTRRRLSYHSDSLHAFTGILSSFKRRFGWNFVSGLPEAEFDLALLWRPMGSITLRPRETSSPSWEQTCTSPTWCWTAWTGDIFWDPWRMSSYAGKAVSLETEVEQFVVTNSDGPRRICRRQDRLDQEASDRMILEVQQYMTENKSGQRGSLRVTKTLSNTVLFFKASGTALSCFLISSEKKHQNSSADMSLWLQLYSVDDAWIYDLDGHHCGTLHGLSSISTSVDDTSLCELILLSRCDQGEVRPTDVDANQDVLPPEHPSSEDYYAQIFDLHHYSCTKWWALNVMLIEWKGKFATRVAIGQIHADAWRTCRSYMRMIALM